MAAAMYAIRSNSARERAASRGVTTAACALEAAVRARDVQGTYTLLRDGQRADIALDGGMTPLLVAISKSADDVIPLLVACGADVNAAQGDPSMTPLTWACLYGASRATVRRLVELGARVDAEVVQMARSVTRAGLSNAHVDLVQAQRQRGCIGVILARIDVASLTLLRLGVSTGAAVVDVTRYSAGERARIQRDDVVVEYAGLPIAGADDLISAVSSRWAGEVSQVRVIRAGVAVRLSVELQPVLRHAAHTV
jgi:hypothetical protein